MFYWRIRKKIRNLS